MTIDPTWAKGIDVSYANARMPNLAGRDFVFVRATYGTDEDSRWRSHSAAVRRAGRRLGAYAFGIRGDGAAQARAFLAIANTADLLVLDLETEYRTDPATGEKVAIPPMTKAQGRAFIAEVQLAGREIGLYHSISGFPSLGQDWNWPAGGPGWDTVAGSTTPPNMPWTIWQYRGAPLDLDVFHGDRAALEAFTRGETMPIYTLRERSGTLTIPAGASVRGWLPRADGTGWRVERTWRPKPEPSSARFDAVLSRLAGTTTPASLLRVTSGFFADVYVSSAEVEEAFDEPASDQPSTSGTTVTLQITGHPDHVTEI